MSSFSAKIEIAFALGVINNECRLSLHLIRDVRNKFAHRIAPLRFDDAEVIALMEPRLSQAVRALTMPLRDKFVLMFQSLAFMLYTTLLLDMRIKPLEQTHSDQW